MRLGTAASLLFSGQSTISWTTSSASKDIYATAEQKLRQRKTFFKNNQLKNQFARGHVNSKAPKAANPFEASAASDEEPANASSTSDIPKKKKSSVLERAQLLQNTKSSSIQKNQNLKECDPYVKDTSVGILSCGSDEICSPAEASDAGGFCVLDKSKKMNPKTSDHRSKQPKKALQVQPHFKAKAQKESLTKKPCDPKQANQRDPTLGVLSCNVGEICQPDMDSVFGGTCVDASSAAAAQRKLMIQKNNPTVFLTGIYPTTTDTEPPIDPLVPGTSVPTKDEMMKSSPTVIRMTPITPPSPAPTPMGQFPDGTPAPSAVYQSFNFCNYDLYDESTGTGTVSCTWHLFCNFLTGVCENASYTTTYVDGYMILYENCYELESIDSFDVPYVDHTYCVTYSYSYSEEGYDNTCEFSIYDTVCNSCTLDGRWSGCPVFDCKPSSFLICILYH